MRVRQFSHCERESRWNEGETCYYILKLKEPPIYLVLLYTAQQIVMEWIWMHNVIIILKVFLRTAPAL